MTTTSTATGMTQQSTTERMMALAGMRVAGTFPDGTAIPGGGGGGPTLPPVAGYTAWYDAQQITAADGSAVPSWTDSSGHGNTLTQGTPANQPNYYKTTGANLINGHPTVYCNGSQWVATAGTVTATQPFTMWAVCQPKTAPHGNNWYVGASNPFGAIYKSSNWTAYFGNDPAPAQPITLNVPVAVANVINGASSILTVNSTSITGLNFGASNITAGIAVGSTVDSSLADSADMLFGEVLFYPFALTPAQISSLYSYAATKWGLPAAPSVAGYTGWWDASQLAGADGSSVATWPDLSGTGNNWTASNQPVLYKTTGTKLINGHPALFFDPALSTRMLFSSASTVPQPYSVFTVATILGLPASNGPLFADSGWDGTHVTMPGGFWGMYAGSAYVNGPAVVTGTAAAVSFVFNGASSSVTKDSTTISGLNPGTASLGGFGGFLGNAPGSPYANMLMGELVFYPFALSPAQITSLHTYAQTKWGTP